ncbi:ATP-binding cassette domain-containing protein [bacterium]|nr:ATP-binding cassette domain-containing protein [bacterium]
MDSKALLSDVNKRTPNTHSRLNRKIRQSGWRWISQNYAEHKYAIRFFLHALNENRKYSALAILCNLLAALFDGSTFAIMAIAIDSLFQSGNIGAESTGQIAFVVDYLNNNFSPATIFLILVGLIIVTQLLSAGLSFGGNSAVAYLQANLETSISRRLFDQFLSISYAQISKYKTGDLISYISQVNQFGLFILHTNTFITTLFTIIVYVGLLLWFSWSMTLVAALVLGLVSISVRKIILKVRSISRTELNESVRVNEHINEYISGMRLVRTFAQENVALQKVEDHLQKSRTAKRQGLVWSSLVSPVFQSVLVIGIACFLLASYFAVNVFGAQPLAQTAVFLLILYRLMPRIGTVNTSMARQMQYLPALERIAAMLRSDDKEYLNQGKLPFTQLQQKIEFKDVSLSYEGGERSALDEFNAIIPRGSMVALVGESGAGKSSIMNLLLRLYEPSSGQIMVDGVDLSNLKRSDWLNHIGIVDQDPFLLNATIRENIAFGKPDADEDAIIRAAQAANAHEFIMDLNHGYDTKVGDRGIRLSGGQRQRISIARAILRDPELLLFDEATSDLDSQSEMLIQAAIHELRQEHTLLVIAHRLSTVSMADSILVLSQGKLVEQGTHAELLETSGTYARFWQIQSTAS